LGLFSGQDYYYSLFAALGILQCHRGELPMQCREQWAMVCWFDSQDLQLKWAQSSSLSFGLRLVSMILPPGKRSYDQRCQLRDDTLCKTLSDSMPKQTASSRIANWIFASMFRVARMRRLLDCDKMSGDYHHSVNCRIRANRGRVVKTSVCLNNNLAVNSRER
jgi:hypothetical protein